MVKLFSFFCSLLIVANFCSCSGMIAAQKGDIAFYKANYLEAKENYKKSSEKKKTINRTIYLLNYSSSLFWNNEYSECLKTLEQAEKSNVSNRNPILSTLVAADRLPYKMKDYELAFLHFFKAVCYYKENEIEKALVELRKSIKCEPQSIFSELLLGLISAVELQDYNTAMVAMRRIISYNPDFLLGYYLLCGYLKLLGYISESEDMANKLKSRQYNYNFLSDNRDNHYLLIFLDLPRSEKDINYSKTMLEIYNDLKTQYKISEAQYNQNNQELLAVIFKELSPSYQPVEPPKSALPINALAILNDNFVKSYNTNIPEQRIKDILKNFVTDFLKDLIKDEARKELTKDAKPVGWLIRGKDLLDPRYWNTLPGRFDVIVLKLPPDKYFITLKFFDEKNNYISEKILENVEVLNNKLNLYFYRFVN